MAETSVADALRALAAGSSGRSDTARLRDIFQAVEDALAAGVTHQAILETLHADGFKLTLKSFQSALYRIRKEKGDGKKEKRTRGTPATPAPTGEAPDSPAPDDLADLDPRARRERTASRFVKDTPANPLLARLTDKGKKA